MGFEEFDCAGKHFARSPIPSQKGEIFASHGLALGIRVLRHERPLLRPQRPSLTRKIQARPAHRIRFGHRFQPLRLKTGLFYKLGWPYPGMVVGSAPAYHYLRINKINQPVYLFFSLV